MVEDERKLSDSLRVVIADRGHEVDCAYDGIEGRQLALSGVYDLLLLDIMLPGIDGLEVLRAVRKDIDTPVLLFTARGQVEDVVSGLQAGADGYLVKPFGVPELLARIQALLRRGRYLCENSLRLGDLELDMVRYTAVRHGRRLDLTAQELKLLALLLRHEGQILSRTMIAEKIWDMNFNSDSNVVDVAVRRLRQKIEDGVTQRLIHTVRGMGYVMEIRQEKSSS
ncbi:MAG: winged helix-turn-helix domain-containing protein [Pseudomonadota bacterium]